MFAYKVIIDWLSDFNLCLGALMEAEELKKAGLKVTLPRLKVLKIFEDASEKHLSAETIYKLLLKTGEDVGLATVYRVLTQFEGAGLLIRHHFDEGHSVYELNPGDHHDHLVCVKCGRVEEFVDEQIENRQLIIAKQHGFEITDHCLYLYGVCQFCQE